MTIDDAIADLIVRIKDAASEAVIRVQRRSNKEASIRVYASSNLENGILDATQDIH